jgi:hypothetical protein
MAARARAVARLPHVMPDASASSACRSGHRSLVAMLAFILLVLLASLLLGQASPAIYVLGFWHYYLYGLAYRYGKVPLPVFKRDAVLMKSVALAALGVAYFSCPLDWLSLAVMVAGFGLNALAARVLGADRTYYGHEVAGLPHRRISAFPYSHIGHPMLVGNMAAHAGTMINEPFREQWWPLASMHVALNLGLLCMEMRVKPMHGAVPGSAAGTPALLAGLGAAGAMAGAAVAFVFMGAEFKALAGALLGAGIVIFARVIYDLYSGATSGAGGRLQGGQAQ